MRGRTGNSKKYLLMLCPLMGASLCLSSVHGEAKKTQEPPNKPMADETYRTETEQTKKLEQYMIPWDVLDGGGGIMYPSEPTAVYSVGGSLGQTAPGISLTVSREVAAGYWAGIDRLPPWVQREFIRCDANADSTVTMSDAIYTLKHLYVPGSDPPTCMKTADTDDNGEVVMSDAIYTLKYLYVPGSPQPPAPFPDCGVDPTADELGCENHPCMGVRQAARRKVGSVR